MRVKKYNSESYTLKIKILMTALTVLIFICHGFFGCGAFAADKKVKRNVLVYYSGKDGNDFSSNSVSELFGIFFDYFGASVRFADLDKGIGSENIRRWADIYIVCHYQWQHPNGDTLCDFLMSAANDKRVVLIGLPGSPAKQVFLIERLGFRTDDKFANLNLIKKIDCDVSVMKGETDYKLSASGDYYLLEKKIDREDSKVLIKGIADTFETVIAGTSNNGAIMFIDKLIFEKNYVRKWMVDPFILARAILGDEKSIIADPCVKSGSRVAMVHIDGDGFNYKAYYKDRRFSGEIITDEIIDHYKVPVSASLIAAEINPADFGSADIEKKAKKLLNSRYVEAGSHSWYHPFDWEKVQEGKIESFASDTEENDQIEDLKVFNPAWKAKQMSIENEITNSVNYISNLTGKKCKVFFWTGKCNPTPAALELCERIGIYNINGGDTRYDAEFDSYSNMSTHYGAYEDHYRYNARYVNEFILTDKWSEPYDGYIKAIEGFKRTGSPHILTPFDIYFHYYIATRLEGLNSLKSVFEYVLSEYPSFMNVSGWIERLRGVISCEIYIKSELKKFEHGDPRLNYYRQAGEVKALHSFSFKNTGKLDNFRWDYDGFPLVDPNRGIMGYNVINGSKYITLGDVTSGEIDIIDKEPSAMYLRSFTGKVLSVELAGSDGKVFKLRGSLCSPLKFTLGNVTFADSKIEIINEKNEKMQYAGSIDTQKKELTFSGPAMEGVIVVSIFFSTFYDNFFISAYSNMVKIFNIFKNNFPLLLVILLYAYFVFSARRDSKKNKMKMK